MVTAIVSRASPGRSEDRGTVTTAGPREQNSGAVRTTVVPVLQRITGGSRDPALASAPGLHYTDTVEVRLLLERLSEPTRS